MQSQRKKPTFLPIPINRGTRPDWSTRLGYPQLWNMFAGDSEFIYSMPWLNSFTAEALTGGRAAHYTPFSGGSYIVVCNTMIYRVLRTGNIAIVATITFSGKAVQIDETISNQIIIVDGLKAYVIDQPKGEGFYVLNETDNTFIFKTPISVLVLNNIGIILDHETNGWAISSANNLLEWPVLENVPKVGNSLTQGISLESLGNNLYIFGTTGIERWEVNNNTNPFSFAFVKDDNFRKDIGALSTNCVIRGIDKIYFLSSKYLPSELSANGVVPLADIGTAKIISQYPHLEKSSGSFYTFRGNYFYHLTIPESGIAWVYCENSKTMGLSDDLVLGALPNNEVVITDAGIFNLGLTPIGTTTRSKKRMWISERMTDYKGIEPYRATLTGFEVRMVQGQLQQPEIAGVLQPVVDQFLYLTFSLDSITWLNTVPRYIGKTGEFEAVVTWRMNLTAYEFTAKVEYWGELDFVIEKVNATIY